MTEIAMVFRALSINKKTVAELTVDEKGICRQAYSMGSELTLSQSNFVQF